MAKRKPRAESNRAYRLPVLSLESQERMARERFAAQNLARNALDAFYAELPLADRQRAAHHPRAQEILVAYGRKLFEIASQEYGQSLAEPEVMESLLRELANRVYSEMRRPVISQSQLELRGLWDDEAYCKRLSEELRVCVEGATKQSLKPNVRQLLNAYLKHRAISRIDLANELRVDRSVIYALFRGERKCGMDVLRRIAHMVGCRIEDLLEMFDATAKRRAKSSD